MISEDDKEQTILRITVAESVRKVLHCGLSILGVSAPEEM